MDIKEVSQVIMRLPTEFDSHDFIREYIKLHAASYEEKLENQNSLELAHGTIALFLKNNAIELGIEKLSGKVLSTNILNNESLNARWRKLQNTQK